MATTKSTTVCIHQAFHSVEGAVRDSIVPSVMEAIASMHKDPTKDHVLTVEIDKAKENNRFGDLIEIKITS
jgi:hypothetical protein